MSATRVILITPNFDNNSLGRTWCLWLLARASGMTVAVHGIKGDRIWEPLAGSDFAADCVLPDPADREARLRAAAADGDILIAVKPLPTSFGIGRALAAELGIPLLLDIDDPDIEARTTWRPWRERLPRAVLSRRYHELRRLRQLALSTPRMVSNPTLARMYGGTVIPHVRVATPVDAATSSQAPIVRFVGSVRAHKGVEVLRRAFRSLVTDGYRLEITAPPPADAAEGETWLGHTSWQEGQHLVATADVIVVPSLLDSWARAQLPAKLIDGMIQGRAIVASRTEPIVWALGDAGLIVAPGDVDGLRDALASLADPDRRLALGHAARLRALELFAVDAVAPTFAAVVAGVVDAATPHPPMTERAR